MLTKGQRTREHIIASAAPVFNVKGFAGASMADILEATGLEKGGIYRHFSSKSELACASFDYALRILEARRTAAYARADTAVARLQASIDVVADSVNSPPLPGGCPILNTAVDADDTHGDLRLRAATAMRDWQQRIVAIVEDGIAAGELGADTDAEMVASLLTSALEGAIMVSSLLQDRTQMQSVARHLRTFVEGLGSGKPTEATTPR